MAGGWKRAAAIAALTVGFALPAAAATTVAEVKPQPAERGPGIEERMREAQQAFQSGEPVKGVRLLLPIVAGPDRGVRNEKEIADLVKRYPDAGVAFVREAQMLAQTFRGKDQALRAARLADWIFLANLIDLTQHRNLQAAIAADAKAQNRDGTAAWLLDEAYGEIPGLNDPEDQRIIFERSLAQAMKVRSDGLVVRLLQHADAAADPAEAARIKEVWKKLKMSEATRSRLERSAPGFRDPAQPPPAPPPPLAVPPPRLPPSPPPADDLSDELDRLNSSIQRLQEQMDRDREAAEDRRRRHETERYWHEKKERKQAEDRAREADRLRALERAREIQIRNERTLHEMEERRRHMERHREEEHRRFTERARQQEDARRDQERRQQEISRHIEEERRRNTERSAAEEARRREQWLREEAGRRAEEHRRHEESARRAEEERRRAHDQQRRAEEDRRRAEDSARRAEEDRRRAQDQQRKVEEERRRAEEQARRMPEPIKRWSK